MKIEKVVISGFGKFAQKEIAFDKGLNVVCGPNESGKTTLQAFISGMLYGLNREEEKRYLPWNQKEFGAVNTLKYTMDNGQSHRVEKNFNRRTTSVFTSEPHQDITALFPVDKKDVLWMEEQTGVNRAAFEASVLIKQRGVRVAKKHCGDITERLLRLSKYGDENIDYNHAVKNLERISDEIGQGHTGKHKKLIQINRFIDELEEEKEKAYEQIKTVRALQQQCNELHLQAQDIVRQREELAQIKRHKRQPLLHRYEAFNQKLEQCRQNQEMIEQQLRLYDRFSKVTKQDVEALENDFNDIKFLEKRAEELNARIEAYLKEKKSIQDKSQNDSKDFAQKDIRNQLIEDQIRQLNHSLNTGVVLSVIITAIAGLSSAVLGNINPLWYLLLAAVPMTVFLLFNYRKGIIYKIRTLQLRKQPLDPETDRNAEVEGFHKIIQELQNEYEHVVQKKEQRYRLLCQKLQAAGVGCAEKSLLPALVHEFKQAFHTRTELQRQLEESQKEIEMLSSNLEIASCTVIEDIESGDEDEEDVQAYRTLMSRYQIDESTTAAQIDRMIEEQQQALRKIELKISASTKELEILSANDRHPGDIEEQLAVAVKEKKAYEDTREAIETAKYFLAQSLQEIQQNYIPSLNTSMSEILSKITADKYQKVDASSELDIVIRDIHSGTLAAPMLSDGTIDQIYFALRLAVARLLSGKETLPFIIDEPFAQYDDERLANTLDFLLSISRERQVILFACQQRELDILKRLDGAYRVIGL